MFKKIFAICLSSILVLSSFSSVSAKEVPDTSSSGIRLMTPSSVQANILKKSNIDSNSVVIVNKNEILSAETLKELEQEDQELASQGLIKTSEIFYISKDVLSSSDQKSLNSSQISAKVSGKAYDYPAYSIRNYVDVVDMSSPSQGLAYLLDVAFNLAVDNVNIKWLSAASILGLSGSSFLPYYVSGDRLIRTENRTFNDTFYMWYDKNNKSWPLVRTTQLNIDVNIDLYQANKPRITDHELVYKLTAHRGKLTWIEAECYANQLYNGSACTYDWYE